MAAGAVAGLILGLLFGVAALLSAVLACASRSESESLPMHTLNSTPPAASTAKKDEPAKPKEDTPNSTNDNNKTQPAKDAKPAENKSKQAAEEWSGAKLWQEYVAKVGPNGGGSPQYVVFDPKSGKIELKPAPANDAPFLKVQADGKVELVQGGGKQANAGGGTGGKPNQQQPQQGKKEEEKKQDGSGDQKGKDDAKKDDKKDAEKQEKKDAKKDETKGDGAKQPQGGGQKNDSTGKAEDSNKKDASAPKADDKKAGSSPPIATTKDAAAKSTAADHSCDAPKLTLQGTIELGQVLKALGMITPSRTASSPPKEAATQRSKQHEDCAGCSIRPDASVQHNYCPGDGRYKYRDCSLDCDHGRAYHHQQSRHRHHSNDERKPVPRHTQSGCRHSKSHQEWARYDS